jgi:hypothetical protein
MPTLNDDEIQTLQTGAEHESRIRAYAQDDTDGTDSDSDGTDSDDSDGTDGDDTDSTDGDSDGTDAA